MIGQVYKVHTDSYSVKVNGNILICGARGVLKKRGNEILVGDYVDVENNTITRLEKRQNRFIRPNVANVDMVVILISPEPKPDFYLIDKLLVNAIKENAKVLFVINKTDVSESLKDLVEAEYGKIDVQTLTVSAKNGDGIDFLRDELKGKLSVLAGQSAVGKTSIVNALFNLDLKTGDVSGIGRGRHTTTRSEIFESEGIRVIDSPGFAVIDAAVDAEDFPSYYPEYETEAVNCKFRGCKHIGEPDCRIKELVNSGVFSKERYGRYVEIYNELLKRRKIYEKN